MFDHLKRVDPDVYQSIVREIKRQNGHLELIASENFTSLAVIEEIGRAHV